jgi:hypothetical protein
MENVMKRYATAAILCTLLIAGPAESEHLTSLVDACSAGNKEICKSLYEIAAYECTEQGNEMSCEIAMQLNPAFKTGGRTDPHQPIISPEPSRGDAGVVANTSPALTLEALSNPSGFPLMPPYGTHEYNRAVAESRTYIDGVYTVQSVLGLGNPKAFDAFLEEKCRSGEDVRVCPDVVDRMAKFDSLQYYKRAYPNRNIFPDEVRELCNSGRDPKLCPLSDFVQETLADEARARAASRGSGSAGNSAPKDWVTDTIASQRCRSGCNPYTDDQAGYQACLRLCD